MIEKLKQKVIDGFMVNRDEALQLLDADLELLCDAANELREHFCGNGFDICTIINGKSGRCSENCKYCAQSAHHPVAVQDYPLLCEEELLKQAEYNYSNGILRYSVVTSGRCLTDDEIDEICVSYRKMHSSCPIALCASHGLLSYEQFVKLKAAGVQRYHNNLETSRRNFPNICTTHTFQDKISTIKAAQKAGFTVCSGGIIGLGETKEDRIDMALDLRELGIRSVPINVLNPIPGTPFAKIPVLTLPEIRRTVAIFRFLLPSAALRMAGGRGLLIDKGKRVFQSGANAAISGEMLTTSGISIQSDMQMISEIGFEVKLL